MSNVDSNKCMFIGLPGSGKSSFIGALWHVASTGEINSSYSLSVQPDDREYLNKLQSSFLECKAPDRTKTDFKKKVPLTIKNSSTGQIVEFTFPDLSGETYFSQFEHRKLSLEYAEDIQDSNSIMLFISPDQIKRPMLISQATPMIEGLPGIEESNGSEDQIKWTARTCQTQVVLVDLLQIITNRLKKPSKLVVIVSAWDLIKNMPDDTVSSMSPPDWLQSNLPLFYQYVVANKAIFSLKVFGVSAQGGAYNNGDNLGLQGLTKQSERIIVQDGELISHDITMPIDWLFQNQELAV